MILLIILGYVALWLAGAYAVLSYVPALFDHRKVKALLAVAVVATLFASDIAFAKFVVSPVALSTFVAKYRANDVPDPSVGKQWCDNLSILRAYPAKICTARYDVESTSYELYHSKTLLFAPVDSFPGWGVVPEARIELNGDGDYCLSVRNRASSCEAL